MGFRRGPPGFFQQLVDEGIFFSEFALKGLQAVNIRKGLFHRMGVCLQGRQTLDQGPEFILNPVMAGLHLLHLNLFLGHFVDNFF